MRLYEWEAKALLAERGVTVPDGSLVTSAEGARQAAATLGGDVVVKAQVLRGGRLKAGLIRFASDPSSAGREAASLLDDRGGAEAITSVLVERKLELESERFLGVLYDLRRRSPVFVWSAAGGIDVEQDTGSDDVVSLHFDADRPVPAHELRKSLVQAGVTGAALRGVAQVAQAITDLLLLEDATLVEVNPLAQLADGRWIALDAHVELDSDALARHPELVSRFGLDARGDGDRVPTDAEQTAKAIDGLDHRGVAGRLIEFDGDIALVMGGGGASLTVFDAIRDAGGSPANYCEVGGNPSVAKVAAFTTLLLGELGARRLAVIMNVVSNTRADLIARGVVQGCVDAGRDPRTTIAVFRVPGAWEHESRELLADYGIEALGREIGIDEASQAAVTTR